MVAARATRVVMSKRALAQGLTCRGAPTMVVTGRHRGSRSRTLAPYQKPSPSKTGMAKPVNLFTNLHQSRARVELVLPEHAETQAVYVIRCSTVLSGYERLRTAEWHSG
eukprot:1159309-Pelagomonas_calceolata.AAC.2